MFIEPIPSEYVYQISDENKCQMLKSHFNRYFVLFCESSHEPSSDSRIIDGLNRYTSGAPYPFLNGIEGISGSEEVIKEQLAYFSNLNLPFLWYVDESADSNFKTKLSKLGFQDIGIFRGVIGPLDQQVPEPLLPKDCTIELVKTESAMNEFGDLVCETFEIHGVSKDIYKKTLWELANRESPKVYHWLAKKNGIAVSALTTFVDGPMVSFWNGATDPKIRREGFSTAIRKIALRDAASRGCKFGASYLMSDGQALGICTRFGFETKWRFHSFLSPLKQ